MQDLKLKDVQKKYWGRCTLSLGHWPEEFFQTGLNYHRQQKADKGDHITSKIRAEL